MTDMGKKELLAKLDEWFGTVYDYGEESDKQAHAQLRKIVEYYFDEGIQQIVGDIKKTEDITIGQSPDSKEMFGEDGKLHKFVKEIQANPYQGDSDSDTPVEVDEDTAYWMDLAHELGEKLQKRTVTEEQIQKGIDYISQYPSYKRDNPHTKHDMEAILLYMGLELYHLVCLCL